MTKIILILFLFISGNLLAAASSSDTSQNTDDNDQIKLLYERAEQYIDEKKFKKSLKILNGLTKREDLSGLRADIYNLLGFSYRKIDKPNLEKSFAAYMMAIEIDPNHIGAHEYLGELYLMMGNLSKAKSMLIMLEKLVGINGKEYLELKEEISKY